jgi:hypothetical protein
MEKLVAGTTLWSDYPLGIVSQGQTLQAFTLCLFLLQKALY